MNRHTPAALRSGLFASALVLAACATAAPRVSLHDQVRIALDSAGRDTAGAVGPRVAISSTADIHDLRTITPKLEAMDDAYVAVLNVWPSGVATVVYPASPGDDGFLRGGSTHVLPAMIGPVGLRLPPAGVQGRHFLRFTKSSSTPGHSTSSVRGPGYLVLVASHTPLDLAGLDTAGYFGAVEFGPGVEAMEPPAVLPALALAASERTAAVTVDHARYGGYDMRRPPPGLIDAPRSERCGPRTSGDPAVSAWEAAFGAASCGMSGQR